jgi:hypothetical protein
MPSAESYHQDEYRRWFDTFGERTRKAEELVQSAREHLRRSGNDNAVRLLEGDAWQEISIQGTPTQFPFGLLTNPFPPFLSASDLASPDDAEQLAQALEAWHQAKVALGYAYGHLSDESKAMLPRLPFPR